jgi:hypothetical protein
LSSILTRVFAVEVQPACVRSLRACSGHLLCDRLIPQRASVRVGPSAAKHGVSRGGARRLSKPDRKVSDVRTSGDAKIGRGS